MARRIQRRRVTSRRLVVAASVGLVFSAVSCAQAPATSEGSTNSRFTDQLLTGNISEDALRGHLSFLASDALEGRGTPSRGLNIAAEYIAAQFRRMGIDPISGSSYFQTVTLDDLGDRGALLRRRFALSGAPEYMHNVAGILRGSDPELRDTYVIVSAHYDHIGLVDRGEDIIYNGANDDASGTASVIEIADALASLPQSPKRSILFLLFFGEERGLLGSQYYGEHPIVPLQQTIAELNLEHMGRTDMDGGNLERTANVTGFDFSSLTTVIRDAAERTDIAIVKNERYSDPFFNQSDNRSLATLGIPAHTISVGYLFPDYHQPSDHWEKINFANMAAVDRAVALAVYDLASSAQAPEWNASLPAAAQYLEAAKKLRSSE